MNTFLPYADFYRSLSALDPKRLGNQVYNECRVLITGGWPHHPAARMWRGYWPALARYALAGLEVLLERGRDYPHHREFFARIAEEPGGMPPWLGDERVHSSHRAVLLWKKPEWYGRFGWTEAPAGPAADGRYPYCWPVGDLGYAIGVETIG